MKQKINLSHYIRVFLLVIVSLIPLVIFWWMSDFTIITVYQQDSFTEEKKECLTDTCLETSAEMSVLSEEDRYYIVPYIIEKVHSKNPYCFDFYFPDLKSSIKEYKVEIWSEDKLLKKVKGTQEDLKTNGFELWIDIREIQFDADEGDLLKVYVEYTLIQNGEEVKHKEKIQYLVELYERTGLQFWWNLMSI
jgi:hypothetical protein